MFKRLSTKARGDDAEDRALKFLQRQGLRLVARNYRVARGPFARAGEVDLILSERDGTLVFVEVRLRARTSHGGAAASVSRSKRQRLIYAASCFLQRYDELPPCRFDVVAVDGDQLDWLAGAFSAEDGPSGWAAG